MGSPMSRAATRTEDPAVEQEFTQVSSGVALTAITAAEIDVQIATAKRFPRSVTKFKKEAHGLACLDAATARTMYYVLPRDGKKIDGPTIRMAEIIVYAWGNLWAAARIVAVDQDTVTAQGVCSDLERNIRASVEIKRGILTKTGARYGADLIRTTCQAAIAVAYREAVFKVVPRSLWMDIYHEARAVSVGDGQTLENARHNWLTHFEKLGVKKADIFRALGVKGEEDMGWDEVITLNGIHQAIGDGDTSLTEAFADPEKAAGAAVVSPLTEKLRSPA